MNIKRKITFVLLFAVTLVIAGCSGTMAVNMDKHLMHHENDNHSAVTKAPTETPWWVNGGIDSNWPY